MSITAQAGSTTRKSVNPERSLTVPGWVHPLVTYSYTDWRLIRDAIEGERDVKDGTTDYLPQPDGMSDDDYAGYLKNATYYNFTGRTLAALVGTLFRRKYKLDGFPTSLEPRLESISKANASFRTFAETAAEEFLAMGRFGVLVDLPNVPSTQPKPYLVPYVTENILDWETGVMDPASGREVLTKVVLREWVSGVTQGSTARAFYAQYRVLALMPGPEGTPVYIQTLHAASNDADGSLDTPGTTVVPQVRGKPLDFIPFHVFEMPRPPILDIARLNISHFRSYAHLEHGRFYTGLPVYYAEVPQGGEGEYYIGPSVVWELPPGARAGVIEFNGKGLGSLENALRDKEAQASSLGGRMIGVTAQSTAETDNQSALKDRNEQALLHRVAHLLDGGFTRILRWFALFAHESADKARIIFNKAFLYDSIGSREFRAIQSMYKDGILPIELVYDYLVKAGVIDEEITVDDLKAMLEDADSFPNNPDFAARKKGYPNAQAKVSDEAKQRELDIAEDELEQDAEQADKDRAQARRTAAAAPKTEPGVQAQRTVLQARGGAIKAPKAR